ncbi:MAG: DUF1566 domain-containing protein [Candidatus Electrothrix sp. AX5]|nr:DUF1566 domain-containing protein [Candidatus Electrothrix sp. AX5]
MRLYKISFLLLFWLTVCMPFSIYAEQTCNPDMISLTPTDQFTDSKGDGTVTDTATGLMWKRCLEGQTYSGGVCSGTLKTVNWEDALVSSPSFAGYTDWRLPNIKELQSIVEEQCYSPAVNLELFPDTPAAGVWSNSPMAPMEIIPLPSVWIINFEYGGMTFKSTGGSYNVRLVRDAVSD